MHTRYAPRQAARAERRRLGARSGAATLDRMTVAPVPPRSLVGLGLLAAPARSEAETPSAADDHHDDDGDGTTTTTAGDGFTPEPIEWDDCGGVECATLDVPLDYDDPDGERSSSTSCAPRPPASARARCSSNPGGPGAGAAELRRGPRRCSCPTRSTSTSTSSASTPAASGGSTPIDCGVTADRALRGRPHHRGRPRTRRRCLEVSEEYVDDCAAKYGDLLPHLGTRDVARDMDAVRAAMGDEQLSYLGFSYGTAIGQVYADLFPDRVRSMVLDGVVELGPTGLELGRRAGRRVRDGPRPLRRVLRRRRGLRRPRATRSRRSRRCSPSPRSPAGSPPPTPTGRPARARPTSASATPSTPRACGSTSATPWPTPSTATAAGSSSWPTATIGIGDFEIYFAVNCLDFAWPVRRPRRVLRSRARPPREDVAALRRGPRQRLRPLRRLAGAARAARAGRPRPAPRRSS